VTGPLVSFAIAWWLSLEIVEESQDHFYEILMSRRASARKLLKDGWQFDATGDARLSGVQNQQDARNRLLRLGLLTSGRLRISIGEPEQAVGGNDARSARPVPTCCWLGDD
jgi:hypothetical protein